MSGICRIHRLPTFVPPGVRLSSHLLWTHNNQTSESYWPLGTTIITPGKEFKKIRIVEMADGAYIERYGYERIYGGHTDYVVLFMRILDGSAFPLYLINKLGIRTAINDFGVNTMHSPTSIYTNNVFVWNELTDILPFDKQDMTHLLCNYYQNDLSESNLLGVRDTNQQIKINEYIDNLQLSEVMDTVELDTLEHDNVLCDTGMVSKIDNLSRITRHGGLDNSDIKRYGITNNPSLSLNIRDMNENAINITDMNKHYDLMYLLQRCPFTDCHLIYTLHNGCIVYLRHDSDREDRYMLLSTPHANEYIYVLGKLLEKKWNDASVIYVEKNYQHDAHISVEYEDGVCNEYYIDLTIGAILTRGLIHL